MLHAFDHPVAMCYDVLRQFFTQHLWMLRDAVVVWPGSGNNVAHEYVH